MLEKPLFSKNSLMFRRVSTDSNGRMLRYFHYYYKRRPITDSLCTSSGTIWIVNTALFHGLFIAYLQRSPQFGRRTVSPGRCDQRKHSEPKHNPGHSPAKNVAIFTLAESCQLLSESLSARRTAVRTAQRRDTHVRIRISQNTNCIPEST